jgi:choline dehydrogenase-like flavoprotein
VLSYLSPERRTAGNTFIQCQDIPNLFIGGASMFPANSEKNPTLSNMALS